MVICCEQCYFFPVKLFASRKTFFWNWHGHFSRLRTLFWCLCHGHFFRFSGTFLVEIIVLRVLSIYGHFSRFWHGHLISFHVQFLVICHEQKKWQKSFTGKKINTACKHRQPLGNPTHALPPNNNIGGPHPPISWIGGPGKPHIIPKLSHPTEFQNFGTPTT